MEWEGRERRYQEALREAREAERVRTRERDAAVAALDYYKKMNQVLCRGLEKRELADERDMLAAQLRAEVAGLRERAEKAEAALMNIAEQLSLETPCEPRTVVMMVEDVMSDKKRGEREHGREKELRVKYQTLIYSLMNRIDGGDGSDIRLGQGATLDNCEERLTAIVRERDNLRRCLADAKATRKREA